MFICYPSYFEYVEGIGSKDDLTSDKRTYDAVLMNFIIIGESSNRLSKEVRAKLIHIDWRAIKEFRNFVAHDYFGIDTNIVWAAIRYNLPQLKKELEELLESDQRFQP